MDGDGIDLVGDGVMSEIRVYRSLQQVCKVLFAPELKNLPQIQELAKIIDHSSIMKQSPCSSSLRRDPTKPFIVLEGLDGSGKTTMAKFLQTKFGMELCATPPKSMTSITNLREFFDSQPEGIRRAFYSLGNYISGEFVKSTSHPIVMDRFWHSTAAYAFACHVKNGGDKLSFSDDDITWPSDLFQPNLVVFLDLSEKSRLARHSSRKDFTNTQEEQALAADVEFRENIKNCYRRIQGVPFVELDVNGSIDECKDALANLISNAFPTAFQSEVLQSKSS